MPSSNKNTRTNDPTQVPALPAVPTNTSPELRKYLETLQQVVAIRLGRRGDPRDRAVTMRELIDSGLAKEQATAPFDSNRSGASGFVQPGAALTDLAVPPVPTAFTVSAAFSTVHLSWSYPGYSNHSHTEVHSHTSDSIGDATLLGIQTGRIFIDPVGSGVTRYYWVRHVNTDSIAGPFNAAAGTVATTSPDVDHLLTLLTGSITSGQLATALANTIDGAGSTVDISNLEAFVGFTSSYSGSSLINRIGNTEAGIAGLTNTFGNTTSAAASAAAAATSESAAIAARAAAIGAETGAVAAKVAALLAQSNAETAESNAETAETNAETAQAAASTSATAASNSATGAAGSAASASTSATAAATSENNAGSSASAAATSASNASTSATSAGTSATASETSKVAAETARSNASTSETNSATSATSAAGSASTATTAATTAANSATASGNSASAAATSATTAATSATAAGVSSTASQTSRLAAETAETNSANSASAAATSATSASTSQTAAGASATAADTDRIAAETAKSSAQSAETSAVSAKNDAESAEANASTSETNAANSATSAGNSASAANTSASNASTSATAAGTASSAATVAKTSAESARDAASTSATAASTSAQTAATQATAAGSAATAASTSATAASTSAGSASTFSTNAAASATTAAGHATTAANNTSSVNTRLNNFGGSGSTVEQKLSSATSDITGLEAQYTVKVDLNGAVSGFGLASATTSNGGNTSEFIVNADRFAIMRGGSNSTAASVPFSVQASATTLNGESVPAGVYMDAAFIKNGSIASAKIGTLNAGKITAGSINADRISANTIDASKLRLDNSTITSQTISGVPTVIIKDLGVGNAKIQNLAVSTLKIQNQAVTFPSAAVTNSTLTGTHNNSFYTYVTVQTLTATFSGAPVMISGSFSVRSYNDQALMRYRLRRGSTTLFTSQTKAVRPTPDNFVIPFHFLDTNTSVGSRTYTLQVNVGDEYAYYSDRTIQTLEVKK